MRLSAIHTPKPGNQLWGIYYTDREYARENGDPLRTVIEAPTKLAAEEQAARLGFGERTRIDGGAFDAVVRALLHGRERISIKAFNPVRWASWLRGI